MKLKLVYLLSDIQKSLAFEWVVQYLNRDKYELSFVLFHKSADTEIQKFLIQNHIPTKYIYLHSKKDYPLAFFKLLVHFVHYRPDIIHTNLRDADFIGQVVGFMLRIKKRIYTRHSSSFNHRYFPHAVKWDQLINWLSTDIVSISSATRSVLIERENVNPKKIHNIPHGFDLRLYQTRNEQIIDQLRQKYHLEHGKPIIGVVSRYISWKGIEYSIRAFQNFLTHYPDAILVLANANGGYAPIIQNELASIPKKNYIEIPFENEINSLYRLFDLFIHVPIDSHIEAFGQIYIESMASGIPSIITKSGIANEIAISYQNCIVVDYENSEEIYQAMLLLMENSEWYHSISESAKKTALTFDIHSNIAKLEQLYDAV